MLNPSSNWIRTVVYPVFVVLAVVFGVPSDSLAGEGDAPIEALLMDVVGGLDMATEAEAAGDAARAEDLRWEAVEQLELFETRLSAADEPDLSLWRAVRRHLGRSLCQLGERDRGHRTLHSVYAMQPTADETTWIRTELERCLPTSSEAPETQVTPETWSPWNAATESPQPVQPHVPDIVFDLRKHLEQAEALKRSGQDAAAYNEFAYVTQSYWGVYQQTSEPEAIYLGGRAFEALGAITQAQWALDFYIKNGGSTHRTEAELALARLQQEQALIAQREAAVRARQAPTTANPRTDQAPSEPSKQRRLLGSSAGRRNSPMGSVRRHDPQLAAKLKARMQRSLKVGIYGVGLASVGGITAGASHVKFLQTSRMTEETWDAMVIWNTVGWIMVGVGAGMMFLGFFDAATAHDLREELALKDSRSQLSVVALFGPGSLTLSGRF